MSITKASLHVGKYLNNTKKILSVFPQISEPLARRHIENYFRQPEGTINCNLKIFMYRHITLPKRVLPVEAHESFPYITKLDLGGIRCRHYKTSKQMLRTGHYRIYQDLPFIPTKIFDKMLNHVLQLTSNLVQLSLRGDYLTSLPKNIFLLSNLLELDVRDNDLTNSDMVSITTLTQLKILHYDSDTTREIPQEIAALTNLSCLSFKSRSVTVVPPAVGSLINLSYLHMAIGPTDTIPPSIAKIPTLRAIEINSKIKSIPIEFLRFENISTKNGFRSGEFSSNLLPIF